MRVADRQPIDDDVVGRRLAADLLENLAERLDQLPDGVIAERAVVRIVLLDRHAAREHGAAFDRAPAQLLGGVLVLLVFEQPPDQLLARIQLGSPSSPVVSSGSGVGTSSRDFRYASVAAITR